MESNLLARLRERAALDPKRIVFPEATDPRVLRAVHRIRELRMAQPILVGASDVVSQAARAAGVSLSGVEILDRDSAVDRYVGMLLPEWRSRGLTEIEARD